jgi:hypothetical protein
VRRLTSPLKELSLVQPGNAEGVTGMVATSVSKSKEPIVIAQVEWSPSRNNVLGVLTKYEFFL